MSLDGGKYSAGMSAASAIHARSRRIEAALREVPRHEFVPAATTEEAYADQAVITKRASNGASLSCASVPRLVAAMLDQLDVQPGDRVLEIGAGTGYNAALLAHLTGPAARSPPSTSTPRSPRRPGRLWKRPDTAR